MVADHGTPANNPDFWNSIDPTKFVSDITAPVQIQVGLRDTAVPPNFSQSYRDLLQKGGKTAEYKEYPNADHNLSPNTASTLHEAVAFFDMYLK
jgi:dipeptidyl aminopeptidase/acylaminoacyl peptidase